MSWCHHEITRNLFEEIIFKHKALFWECHSPYHGDAFVSCANWNVWNKDNNSLRKQFCRLCLLIWVCLMTLQWRHNERDGVLKHRCLDCLLNRLYRRRSKKTPKLRVTGLCEVNSAVTGKFHKGPVTRKMFPFDDVIMDYNLLSPWTWIYWLVKWNGTITQLIMFITQK